MEEFAVVAAPRCLRDMPSGGHLCLMAAAGASSSRASGARQGAAGAAAAGHRAILYYRRVYGSGILY